MAADKVSGANETHLVAAEDMEDHAKSLRVQGQLHHLVDDTAASLWSEVVQKLPPECMLRIPSPIMPTCQCGGGKQVSRSLCKLCGKRQTLLHVLNHCQVALELRRYNQRHDKRPLGDRREPPEPVPTTIPDHGRSTRFYISFPFHCSLDRPAS